MNDAAPLDGQTPEPCSADDTAQAPLSLWDAVSLVIGIVVGTSIFRSPQQVFENTHGPWEALAAWALGGVLSLAGAMCYAELATTYPRSGGDYEYLTRAYGPWAGFLFGWAQLTAVFAANVGIMAYAFADYGVVLLGLNASATVWLAVAAIVGMSLLNAWTVHVGVVTQNVLTAAKVLGLASVILAGARIAAISHKAEPGTVTLPDASGGDSSASFGLAMVFVLYAYGGWNDAALVAAEVRNRRRTLPLALVGGVAAITIIYLAANLAYLTLGFDAARRSQTPAADILQAATGPLGSKLVSALVMISALGAINGMILSRSRIFAVMGNDHRVLKWLGGWHAGHGAPRASLAAQALVTVAMVLFVGTERGRGAIDAALQAFRAPRVPWDKFFGGFNTLIAATAPVFWTLFLAAGVALIVLRRRDPHLERPFQVPFYPLTPLVFCGTCVFMLYRSAQYAGWLAAAASVPVAAGLVLYLATRSR